MIMGGEPTTVHLLMKEQTQKRLGFKVLNSFVLSITLVKVISGFVLFLFNFHLLMYFCRFFQYLISPLAFSTFQSQSMPPLQPKSTKNST